MFKPEENTIIVVHSNFEVCFPLLSKDVDIFFISHIQKNIFGKKCLYGQFLSEFETNPQKTLELKPNSIVKLHFPSDRRVLSYSLPQRADFDKFYRLMDIFLYTQPKLRRATERLKYDLKGYW